MTTYDSALIEQLCKEALAAFDVLPVPQTGAANHRHLAARAKLSAMADQLEAARLTIDALMSARETDHECQRTDTATITGLRAERDNLRREVDRLHRDGEAEMDATCSERDTWKQMYEGAEQSAAKLTAECNAARAEVARLKQRVCDQDEELQAHAERAYRDLMLLDAAARRSNV